MNIFTDEYKLNDDVLSEVYLAKKKIDHNTLAFKTGTEEYYLIDKNIVLEYPKDTSDLTFSIFNLTYKVSPKAPFQEIYVNPNVPEIDFYAINDGNRELRFYATFDNIDKSWDVRSNMTVKNKATSLNKALEELIIKYPNGVEESESFIEMINSTRKLFNQSEEKKLEKK